MIGSLSFRSLDGNGNESEYSGKYGGNSGKETIVSLQWPHEFLASISGTQTTFEKKIVVESLTFHTNMKKYGPFGGSKGTPFDFALKDEIIVGFHGRHSKYIDAIGVYHQKALA